MQKLQLTSRKVLAALMAVVMVLTMIPTMLVDSAEAATYVANNDGYYFWDEQGLRDVIARCAEDEYGGRAYYAVSQSDLTNSNGTLTIRSDLTIPENVLLGMGNGQLVMASGATLTLNGRLVTRADRAVQGKLVVAAGAGYWKICVVTDGARLNSELQSSVKAAASDTVATSYEVDLGQPVTVNGNLTVPAGAILATGEGNKLTVTGKVTVEAGGYLYCDALEAGSVEVKAGGELDANGTLYYKTDLTVSGIFYASGEVCGTGDNSGIYISNGAKMAVFTDASVAADRWFIAPGADIANYGLFMVPLAQRGNLARGANTAYSMTDEHGNTGVVQCLVTLTDAQAAKPGALQAAINGFDSAGSKMAYEQFAVLVHNAREGQALQLTLTENVTVGGSVDSLIVVQSDWPETAGFAPAMTIAKGAKLTVNAGKVLSVGVPLTVNGELELQDDTIYDPALQSAALLTDTTINGLLSSRGKIEALGNILISGSGTLRQTAGTTEITGNLHVDGTLDVQAGVFGIIGLYTKGTEAVENIGADTGFWNQITIPFDPDAIAAAFASDGVDTLTATVNGDVTLTKDMTIPTGKALELSGEGTLTIAPGVALTLEKGYYREENTDGGKLTGGVKLVVQGTLAVQEGAHANPHGTMTVEKGGTLAVEGSLYCGGWTFILRQGGRVINNGRTTIQVNETTVLEDSWENVWTQGADAHATASISISRLMPDNAAAQLRAAMDAIPSYGLPAYFEYAMDVWNDDDTTIELAQDLTVPADVSLNFYQSAVRIAAGTTLTLNGDMYVDQGLDIAGTLIVNGNANIRKNTVVTGTLTVNRDAWLDCEFITDVNEAGEHGVITVTGDLMADESDIRYNDVVPGHGGGGQRTVSTLEELKTALAQGGDITYQADELTVAEDLAIPEDVNLTIRVNKLTVNENVTLTNCGYTNLYGDLYLNGKLDVSGISGYFYGYGRVMAGDESHIIGDEYGSKWYVWSAYIKKSGADATLTQQELTAAMTGAMAERIQLELEQGTTLTTVGSIEIKDMPLNISSGKNCQLVINDSFTASSRIDAYLPTTVNGTMTVKDTFFSSADITVNEGGKLIIGHNGSVPGTVSFNNLDAWVRIPEGGAWSDYVTVEEGALLEVSMTIGSDELAKTLEASRSSAADRIYLNLWNDRTISPVTVGTTLVIPENVTVRIHDVNRISGLFVEQQGELIVNGALEMGAALQVDGVLTLNGCMRVYSGNKAAVNGTLTVGAGAEADIDDLSGKGTITNNGTMTVYNKSLTTKIGGSGKTTVYNVNMEISTLEELKEAAAALKDAAEATEVVLRRSAMDEANPYFVIDEDIEIPAKLHLRVDETSVSNFRGIKVAEGVTVNLLGEIADKTDEGLTVAGKLRVVLYDFGGIAVYADTEVWCGAVNTRAITVETGGTLVNEGRLDVRGDGETGGVLTVNGTLENNEDILCEVLRNNGTVYNRVYMYVEQTLEIAENATMLSDAENLVGQGCETSADRARITAFQWGDVNGDGVVDRADLSLLARYVAHIQPWDYVRHFDRSDINGDGRLSAADLTALAQIIDALENPEAEEASADAVNGAEALPAEEPSAEEETPTAESPADVIDAEAPDAANDAPAGDASADVPVAEEALGEPAEEEEVPAA